MEILEPLLQKTETDEKDKPKATSLELLGLPLGSHEKTRKKLDDERQKEYQEYVQVILEIVQESKSVSQTSKILANNFHVHCTVHLVRIQMRSSVFTGITNGQETGIHNCTTSVASSI